MIRTVLVIGASGFLGTHLALNLREGYKVFGTYNDHPVRLPGVTSIPLRFQSPSSAKQVLSLVQPDIIVFAAGSSNLEWVERYPRDEEKVQTGGAGSVFTAPGHPPRLIYLSSPHVFDGVKGNFKETDMVLPTTTMGRLKLSGENFVRAKSLNYIILRTSPVLGRGNGLRPTLLDDFRMRLGRGERLTVPEHETYSFVTIWNLVETVSKLIESGFKNRTFHLGGLNKLTTFELARRFAKRFGYNPDLVFPGLSATDPRVQIEEASLKRYDFSLNSSQLIDALKFKPLLLEESFDLIEKKLITGA